MGEANRLLDDLIELIDVYPSESLESAATVLKSPKATLSNRKRVIEQISGALAKGGKKLQGLARKGADELSKLMRAKESCWDVVGCAEDGECGDGEICEGMSCVNGCRQDSQCGDGAICEAQVCISGCRVDGDCGPDGTCDANTCVDPCQSDASRTIVR